MMYVHLVPDSEPDVHDHHPDCTSCDPRISVGEWGDAPAVLVDHTGGLTPASVFLVEDVDPAEAVPS